MIINKIDNTYTIKLLNNVVNIYNPDTLEQITKELITKINKKQTLKNNIKLEFYTNKNYGTIIKLKDYKTFTTNKNKTVKITIHTETPFLYQMNYFDTKKFNKKNLYYYKNKFYLEINDNISTKDYYKLLELSKIIYEDSYDIIDKAIKI